MSSLITHINRYAVTESGLELFANFYYPPKCQDGKPRGLFVAYHGGGIIVGSRDEEFIFEPVRRAVLDNGYILVQPGYRLLMPVSGHEIVKDVKNFYDYLASDVYAKTLPPGVKPDLSKIVVSGFSGGGYVCRLAAIDLIEKTKSGARAGLKCAGMVSYFGMGGDIFQPAWIDSHQSAESTASKDPFGEVDHIFRSPEISDAPYTAGLKGWENKAPRDIIWDWFTHNGLFVDLVAGTKGTIRDAWQQAANKGDRKPEDVVPQEHHEAVPQIWFGSGSNAKDFPPSMFVHGTADDVVPYAETLNTVDQLRKAGNEVVELITIEGVDHHLKVPGEEECGPEVDAAHEEVARFILKRLA